MLEHAPTFTSTDAEAIARERYACHGAARTLTSERDQNFLIDDDAGGLVLKIANALEERPLLEAQQHVLAFLGQREVPTPRVICTANGDSLAEVSDSSGRRHFVWAVSRLPGKVLADVRHRSSPLLEDLGATIGRLDVALASVEHPALHREFHWDLARAPERIRAARSAWSAGTLGEAVDVALADFERHVLPRGIALRRSVIHNDLNDRNILVADDRISGIVDFGDMLYGWRVADLSIAAAYAMLDAPDPLQVLASLVRGAHRECALDDVELDVIYALAKLRLALSAAIAIHQQQSRPENSYLGVSQEAIRRTLPRLTAVPYDLATAVIRDAAGREPIPRSARVRDWLATHALECAPVLGIDLRAEPSVVLDLSVGSPLVSGDPDENTVLPLTARIEQVMREAGVRIAVGRYDEPRLLYTAPFFGGATAASERRTIHIGLDLFAEAGTGVFAPLDGTVEAFANNAVPQDYGPVVILRHATGTGDAFFTLYGHLSRASLAGLHVGQRIERGQRFAWLGTPDENVGWTPHLHLQIITDLLGVGTDFPGVAPASQRAVWRNLSPDPNLLVGVPEERFPQARPDSGTRIAVRRRRLGANLSIAYREPVHVERGWMQYLYDDIGRRYVDAYNNVPHVGHCHPRVVRAGQEQMAVLNTNTRYPSDVVNFYADRLARTLPGALGDGVVYLVNSASEANELALRLARSYTGARDMIVLEAAYHGNTTSLIDLSPYKHAGPGGAGAPDWVHAVQIPDTYRGEFRQRDRNAGTKYAERVGQLVKRLRDNGRVLAGFIAETCPSVGGQIFLPPAYLRHVYEHVRNAGGVTIADEVQTGLGRIGSHFWAFEAHDVIPDIVVMGKPLGNGHPIGAVVARRKIAESFDNGMEYFSTFGGNQVSCAIGLAVLDVLRDEELQKHALRVGDRMLEALRPLVDRHRLVGDVRGSGLFLGVELVRDRETLEPADREASCVVNRMREEGILLGTDGPCHNVLKIRPPMPFDDSNADRLVETLDAVLAERSS